MERDSILNADEEQEVRTFHRRMAYVITSLKDALEPTLTELERAHVLAACARNFFFADQRNSWAAMEKAMGNALRHGITDPDDE